MTGVQPKVPEQREPEHDADERQRRYQEGDKAIATYKEWRETHLPPRHRSRARTS